MLKLDQKSLDDVLKRLAELDLKVRKKALSKAVRRAMAPVRNEVKSTAPVDTGELKANVTLRTSARKNGNVYARVGIKGGARKNPDTPYYFRMVEFGTHNMPARPFMRPALESNAAQVLDAVAEVLRQELGL